MAKQYFASDYAYGINPDCPALEIIVGFTGTGSQSCTVASGVVTFKDTYGQNSFSPLATNAPVNVGGGATLDSSITPSSVTLNSPNPPQATFAASFTYAHGNGTYVQSATCGLQEALNAASNVKGGAVVVDGRWAQLGGTSAMLLAAANGNGSNQTFIIDNRGSAPAYWTWSGTAWTSGFAESTTLNLATQPTFRQDDQEVAYGYAGSTTVTGSVVAVRGAVTVGATTHLIGTGSYTYGVQGKFINKGYVATTGGNGIIQCAVLAQLDLSQSLGVAAGSQVTGLWVDCGASVGTVTGSCIDVSTFYNNIAALTCNSVFRVLAQATYLFDLTDSSVFLAGTSCNTAGGTIAVNTTAGVRYIGLFTTKV